VIRLVQTIRDLVAVHKAVCILSLKASTLEPARLASLQRELEIFSPDGIEKVAPMPDVENRLIAELKRDEMVIEVERVAEGHKALSVKEAKLTAQAKSVALDREALEKERQEVRQTLIRVRQTRKELEEFRIKLTKEEAVLTSKVRSKLAKELETLDSKKAALQAMEKEVESRYHQLDRIVTLKTEQKMAELNEEQRRLETDRGRLADLTVKAENDRRSLEERLKTVAEREERASKSLHSQSRRWKSRRRGRCSNPRGKRSTSSRPRTMLNSSGAMRCSPRGASRSRRGRLPSPA
jgi:chromosome segregation ATPase